MNKIMRYLGIVLVMMAGLTMSYSQTVITPDANQIIYVTEGGTGDGSSWTSAAGDLNAVVTAASGMNPKPVVWVAQGTYVGDGVADHSAFTMAQGINVYGGFAGNEASDYDLDLRDFTNHATILDGQNVQRVLYQANNFTQATETTWDGFTIQNGYLTTDRYGGGAYIRSYGKLKNCIIDHNTISYSNTTNGGGVYLSGYGTLENCEISNNLAYCTYNYSGRNAYGGGVYDGGHSSLINCNIHHNTARYISPYDSYAKAGGVYLNYQSVMRGCTVSNNTAGKTGGAYLYGSTADNCSFLNNSAVHGEGGGLWLSSSTVTNSTISHNTSSDDGGGVYQESNNYLTGCVVSNNTSAGNGGGVYVASNNYLTNTLVVNNLSTYSSSSTIGAGVYTTSSTVYLTNCVVWGNKLNAAVNNLAYQSNYVPYITYTAIENGWSGAGNIPLSANNTGSGLIPKFTQPTAGAGATYPGGDWRPLEGSVLINKGTQTALPSGVTLPLTDLAGNNRVQSGQVDIGPYETSFSSGFEVHADSHHIIYVSPDGTGDGSSWTNATHDLNMAVSAASAMNPVASVWVKTGTYTGNTANTSAFFVYPSVNVYGGFAGNESYDYDLSLRDFVSHPSILDGQQQQRVLCQNVDFTQATETLWDGFVIQNGRLTSSSGTGAYIRKFMTLKNCVIRYNTHVGSGSTYGAGVYVYYGTLDHCEIYENCINHPSTSWLDCFGAGVYASASTVKNCDIHDNSLFAINYDHGCGIYATNASIVESCTIRQNQSSSGGGVYCYGSTIKDCVIEKNTATSVGGGVYTAGTSRIINTIVANNLCTSQYGAGVECSGSTYFLHCTVVNNQTKFTTSGAGINGLNYAYIYNTVVWGNRLQDGTTSNVHSNNVFYSAIEGGQAGTGNVALTDSNTGSGFCPMFTAPSQGTGVEYGNGDWTFQDGSALINRGTATDINSNLTMPDYDIVGNDRIRNGKPDIGAYESGYTYVEITPDAHNIIYVKQGGAGTTEGTSWANAASNLNTVLVAAASMNPKPSVWVAQGTYVGDSVASNNAFTMVQGVNVYGGFAGNETYDYDLTLRDFTSHASILDGQNVQRVLCQINDFTESTTTTWDGFVIEKGKLTDSHTAGAGAYIQKYGKLKNCVIRFDTISNGSSVYGGGVYMRYGSLENCEIYGNLASCSSYEAYGGGVYNTYGVVTDCNIHHNEAVRYDVVGYANGGGLYLGNNAEMHHCYITHNTSIGPGGGLYVDAELESYSPVITDCTITDNIASSEGGGAYLKIAKLTNCIISNNMATRKGGGVYAYNKCYLTNCLISNNTSEDNGGGVYANQRTFLTNTTIVNNLLNTTNPSRVAAGIYFQYSNFELTNCVVWGNKRNSEIDNIYENSSSPVITYSAIEGGWTGEGNIALDSTNTGTGMVPNFILPTSGAGAMYTGGVWIPLEGSPLIDAGTTTGLPDGMTLPDTDLNGHDRILDDAIDMGAYEQYCTRFRLVNVSLDLDDTYEFYGTTISEPGNYVHLWSLDGEDCDSLVMAHVTRKSAVWYVTSSGAGTRDGSSWANASNDLNALLDEVARVTDMEQKQVWVATGTYQGLSTGSSTFQCVGGVEVYGGFAGNETSLSQRDPDNHPTILQGSSNRVLLTASTSYPCTAEAKAFWDGFTFNSGKQLTIGNYITLSNCKTSIPVVANGRLLRCEFTGFNDNGTLIMLRLNEGAILDSCQVHHNNCKYALVRAEDATIRYSLFYNNTCSRGYSGGEGKSWGALLNAIDNVLVDHCDFVNNRVEYPYQNETNLYVNMEDNDIHHLRQPKHTLISLHHSTLQNSIVWGNEQGIFTHDFIAKDIASEINYCAIESSLYNGIGNIRLAANNELDPDIPTIFVPDFINPTPGIGHFITLDDVDWSLDEHSVCLKQGADGSDIGAIASDADAVISLQPTDGIIYVAPEVESEGNGSSWAQATTYLQYAVARANTFNPAAEVWVKEGVYTGDSTYYNNAFNVVADVAVYGGFAGTETSLNQRDPETHPTILDGQSVQRVLYQNEPIATGHEALWDGFVIRNGLLSESNLFDYNGTILIHPSQSDLRYQFNHLHGAGASLMANATLKNTTLSNNRIDRDPQSNGNISVIMKGTSLSLFEATLNHVTVSYNTTDYSSNNNLMQNSYVFAINAQIDSSLFTHNVGKIVLYGGSVNASHFTYNQYRINLPEQDDLTEAQLYADHIVMRNCRMAYNNAVALNKFFSGSNYSNTFHNCQIDHNNALAIVGHESGNNDLFINCNITNNKSSNRSSYAHPISGGVFHNTIVWGNRDYTDAVVHFNLSSIANHCSFNNCAVEYGLEGYEDEVMTLASSNKGTSQAFAYPYFLSPESGDYTLITDSDLIDAGDNSVVDTDYDFIGYDRTANDVVDIGAYEYRCIAYREYNDVTMASQYPFYGEWLTESGQYVHRWSVSPTCDSLVVLNLTFKHIIYVTETGSGLQDGSSWENAFGSLKDATEYAGEHVSDLNQIWVAEGLYRGDGTSVNAFRLFPNTQLYGGLTGTELGDYDLNNRDLENHVTILDGDYIQRVIYQEDDATEEFPLIIDGFTIKNGFSRANVSKGTALYLKRYAIVRNCKITENYTMSGVEAVYMENDDFDDCDQRIIFNTFENCDITENQGDYTVVSDHCAFINCKISSNTGHGVYVMSYTKMDDCELVSNQGRAIYLHAAAHRYYGIWGEIKYTMDFLDLTNCKITNNAGGIYYEFSLEGSHAQARIMSCLIANNTANNTAKDDTRGGAIFGHVNEIDITCSTIVNNTAKDDGGALYGTGFKIVNTILSGNKASGKSNQLSNHYYYLYQIGEYYFESANIETCDITYSAIEGGYPGKGNISLNDSDMKVLFGSNYQLAGGSPCINHGTTVGVTIPEYDLAGNSRVLQGRIDIGAFESDFTGRILIQPDSNNIIYVTEQGSAANDGSSWDNATSHFQMALNMALCYDPKPQIWVKKGKYGNDNAQFWSNLAMMPGVNVYGGFKGDEAASYDLSQRDLVNDLSILDGGSNKRVLEQFSDFDADDVAVWDGFHIKSGNAREGYIKNIRYMSESAIDGYFKEYMYGGGVLLRQGGSLSHCEIYDNVAIKGGGVYRGMLLYHDIPSLLTNCKVRRNYAVDEGGGIYLSRATGDMYGTCPVDTIANCEISGNTSDRYGGLHAVRTRVIGSSIIKNTTDLYAFDTISSTHQYNHYQNCVLWGNDSRNYAFQTEGNNNTYDYCAIQGGAPAENTGTGIIDLAIDNTGSDPDSNYPFFLDDEEEIYRPTQHSAFVNQGTNDAVYGNQDLAFKNRVKDAVVDMGAYEETCLNYEHKNIIANRQYDFYGRILTESGSYEHQWTPAGAACDSLVSLDLEIRCIWYVKQDGAGSKDGSSWANATDDLNWAISQASACDTVGTKQVWVAQGTYHGNGTSMQAFTLKPNIEILGGFEGNEEEDIDFDERDFVNHASILDGSHTQRVLGNYGYESNFGPMKRVTIDGFTIQNGYTTQNGGGVYAKNYVTLKNLVVKNNQGGNGAGIYVDSHCEVNECDIFSNTALRDGGGAWVRSSTLNYCEIYRNLCDNVQTGAKNGGGIYGCNATINNCLIANNSVLTAGAKGGGMYIDYSQVASQLLNCTMVNNYSYDLAGGVYSVNSGSNNEFINCVLWGNRTDLNTQQIAVSASNVPIYLRYCAVQGGAAGIGNIKLTEGNNTNALFSPKFVSPSENVGANYGGGDWHFQEGSILANHGERLNYTITKDLDNENRVKNNRIDIGAFESNYTHDYAVLPDAHNTIYVDATNNSGNCSGDSWANAIPDLQLAINFAADDDNRPKIWIKGGTYTGNGWPYVDAFVGLNGIDLYGGFAGNEAYDYDLEQRDLVSHATILDGQNIQRTLHQAHSSFFKYKQIEELHSAVYDGLTLRNGFVYQNNGGVALMYKGNIRRCIIENGEAMLGSGGGLYVGDFYSLTMDNSIIRNCKNTAVTSPYDTYFGGGYHAKFAVFHNCLFANNSTCTSGGAGVGGTHYNSTIVNNYAEDDGGGLYSFDKIYNSVLWGNKIGNNLPCQLKTGNPAINAFGSNDVLYSAIEGGFAGEGNINLNPSNSGSSDINYPMFRSPSIAAGVPAGTGQSYVSASDDWSFQNGSVLANHGSSEYAMGSYDLAHNNRIQNDVIDMGAYESPYDFDFEIVPDAHNIIYVTQDGAGTKNGSSWSNATPYLQYALDRSSLMSQRPRIWVAAGNYTGNGSPAYTAFVLPDGISLYGGFAGNEPYNYDLSERDLDLNITRLDGQNLQQIMRRDYLMSYSTWDTIDGFTFQNGRTNREGGAAYLKRCHVENCNFQNNTVVWESSEIERGGGALCSSDGHIYHCSFTNNYSNHSGGAINSTGDIINWCFISNNTAEERGGGINGNPEVYNTEISYNQAKQGGGMYRGNIMRNCTVVKNSAELDGASQGSNGGGLYLLSLSGIYGQTLYDRMTNNIIWGNRTGALVSNVRGDIPKSGTITYTAFESDATFPSGTGNIVLQSDNDGSNSGFNYVRFSDPDHGDFTLQESSMCINVGNNTTAAPGVYDLAGNNRIQDDIIDLGAYEMNPVNCHVPTNLNVPDDEITFTTADVYWTPADAETEWVVYYMPVDGVTPTVLDVTENHVQLQDLSPNLEYLVKVRSKCSDLEMSAYSLPVYFTTACDPESIVWTNYLDETGLLPVRDQALQSNDIVLFSWDYIDGAETYDLYLWRTDYGNGLPIPDMAVRKNLTTNHTTVDLDRSLYQGIPYANCTGWCYPEPPLYLHQYDTTDVAYYAWYVVAHQACGEIRSDTMTFTTALPDLHVTALDCSYAQTGQMMTVSWTVQNDGVGPTPIGNEGMWNDYIVLSYPHNWTHESFTQPDPESFIIETVPNLRALNPGESYTNEVNVRIPDDMYGTVFLFVLSNWTPMSDMHLDYSSYGGVFPDPYLPPYIPHNPGDPEGYMRGTCSTESFHEIVDCDNFFYKRIEVDIPPFPDLIVDNVTPPYEAIAGDSIVVSWRVINQGRAGFEDVPVTNIVYMSTDTVYSSEAKQVATFVDTISMTMIDTIAQSMKFITDEHDIGTYNFFVRVDATNRVYESLFEGNNVSPISEHSTTLMAAPPADLVIEHLTVGIDTVSPYEWFPFSYQVRNIGYMSAKPLSDPNYGGGISDTCGVIPPWRGKQWADAFFLSDQRELNLVQSTHLGNIPNDTILYMPVDLPTIETMIVNWADCHYPSPEPLGANATHQDSLRYLRALDSITTLKNKFIDNQLYYYTLSDEGDSIQHNRYINSYSVNSEARAPQHTSEGMYYFFAWTDRNDVIFEYQREENNMAVDSIYVVQPDLTIDTIWINETRDSLNFVLHNIGRGKMIEDNVSLVVHFNNAQVGRKSTGRVNLASGATYEGSVPIGLPCNFYEVNSLKLTATPENDKDFTNNTKLIEDYHLKNPDFLAHSLLAPTNLQSGDSLDVVYNITNKGAIGYEGDIQLGVYLGLSPELNFHTAVELDVITYPVSLGMNDTVEVVQSVALPIEAQGTYYFYVVVNDGEGICEGDNVFSNYIVSDPVVVTLSDYPDLVVTEATVPGEAVAGLSISIGYTAINQGIRAITEDETWVDAIYVSNHPQFSVANSSLLATVNCQGPLGIGETYTLNNSVTLPPDLANDYYYIYIISDLNDNLFEYVGEYNNTYQSASFIVHDYDFNLAVTAVTGPSSVQWNEMVTIHYGVTNMGSRASINEYYDKLYLSSDMTWDEQDLLLGSVLISDIIQPDEHYDGQFMVRMPYGNLGDYHLLVVADAAGVNPDANLENNVASLAVSISSIPVPDLQVSDMEILTEYPACGQPIEMRYKVTNVGDGPTSGNYADRIVLSRNTYTNGRMLAVENRTTVLQPNEYYYDTVSFIVPVPETGNYAVYVNANYDASIFEMERDNNMGMIPLVVDLNAPGDLVVTDISFASYVTAGDSLVITWNVKNLGPNRLDGIGCSDVLYLSNDDVFDSDDILLGNISYDLSLAENMSESHSFAPVIAGVPEGYYYVIILTDARNTFYEMDEDNNRVASSSTVKVELEELPFNTQVPFVLDNLKYKDYKLKVNNSSISETVRIYVTSKDSLMGAVNNIYVLYDGVGSNLDFDISTDGQMTSNSELYIARTQQGYYGVSVLGNSPVHSQQDMTIQADILPFEVRSISPDYGGNTGKVTVKLIGSKFRPDMEVYLCNANDTIAAEALQYVNFNEAFATFNLKGAEIGYYTLKAINYCAGTYYIHNGFRVVEGEPENLATNLIIPVGLRQNRYCCLTLEYGNIGNTDIVNPRIVLRSLGESWIGLRRGELNIHRTELEIPTQFEGEPDGVLRPGVRHTITIYCYTNAELYFGIDVNEQIDAHEYLKNLMLH